MKRCARCRRRKPKSEFYKSKKNPDGLYSYCQPCARKQRLAYIHADPNGITTLDGLPGRKCDRESGITYALTPASRVGKLIQ